jgi:hypothetical protein
MENPQEWGQDEVRMLTIREGIPTHIVCRKSEIEEEINNIQSWRAHNGQ